MAARSNPFVGTWRIVEMEQWDEATINEYVPAQITFTRDGGGSMQFIYVDVQLDWRPTKREGAPALEFSFEGHDEMDEVSGRGWVRLKEPDELEGWFAFHQGDESTFSAERDKVAPRKAATRRARKR